MNNYRILIKQVRMMFEEETAPYGNMANLSAMIFEEISDLNWVGFYMWSEQENCLLLHAFQGKTACTRIDAGAGVCGTAYTTQTTQRVDDVHAFDGHIACDSASNSELVIPLIVHGKCLGVLDIDSPKYNRFDANDQTQLETIAQILLDTTDLTAVQS